MLRWYRVLCVWTNESIRDLQYTVDQSTNQSINPSKGSTWKDERDDDGSRVESREFVLMVLNLSAINIDQTRGCDGGARRGPRQQFFQSARRCASTSRAR